MSVLKKRLLKFRTRNKSEALNKVKREIKKRGMQRRVESRRSRISCRCRGGRGGREAPIVAVRRRRNSPNPKGAPHRVNWKTVRWTVFQEGHALQGRAAPSVSPADSPLQGRTPLNEPMKSPKPVITVCIYINAYISKYFHTLSRSNNLALLHFPTRGMCFLVGNNSV